METMMTGQNSSGEKLQQIQDLWVQLEQVKPDTAEYEAIAKKIRILSVEYQALTEVRIKPINQNESLPENGLEKGSPNMRINPQKGATE